VHVTVVAPSLEGKISENTVARTIFKPREGSQMKADQILYAMSSIHNIAGASKKARKRTT
jgi:hypothetical protein